MALTQSDLDAIDTAIASGVLTYEHNGTRVTYGNFREMLARRAFIAEQVAPSSAIPARTVGVYDSGLRGPALPFGRFRR